MRQVWTVFSEELRRAFRSPTTFALLSLFFLMTGALYLSAFFQASTEPLRVSPLALFWELQWLPNLVWVPLLTMRLLASERRAGLLASTLATPITPFGVVFGKYLSALFFYILGWLSVGLWGILTRFSGLSAAELALIFSPSAIAGGALFCFVSGCGFLALGLWCSSLTHNTILAGALTICLMLLYMLLPTFFSSLTPGSFGYLKPFAHLENLSEYVSGALPLSVAVAYMIVGMVFLFLSALSLERRGE